MRSSTHIPHMRTPTDARNTNAVRTFVIHTCTFHTHLRTCTGPKRTIVCGLSDGRVEFRSSATLEILGTLRAHASSVLDMHCHKTLLATCGHSHRTLSASSASSPFTDHNDRCVFVHLRVQVYVYVNVYVYVFVYVYGYLFVYGYVYGFVWVGG